MMKRYNRYFEEVFQKLYHSSNFDFVKGKVYKAASTKGTFGDFEKLLEEYKPKNAVSRLLCFYTTDNKRYSSQFGGTIYNITPIGKYTFCSLGWISILMDFCFDKGYVSGFSKKGYTLSKIQKEDIPFIQKCVVNYFTNVPIKKKDILGIRHTEYGVTEVLCTSIKIL